MKTETQIISEKMADGKTELKKTITKIEKDNRR